MKKIVTSATFKSLLGALVFLLPGGAVILIAATLFTRSNLGRAFITRITTNPSEAT